MRLFWIFFFFVLFFVLGFIVFIDYISLGYPWKNILPLGYTLFPLVIFLAYGGTLLFLYKKKLLFSFGLLGQWGRCFLPHLLGSFLLLMAFSLFVLSSYENFVNPLKFLHISLEQKPWIFSPEKDTFSFYAAHYPFTSQERKKHHPSFYHINFQTKNIVFQKISPQEIKKNLKNFNQQQDFQQQGFFKDLPEPWSLGFWPLTHLLMSPETLTSPPMKELLVKRLGVLLGYQSFLLTIFFLGCFFLYHIALMYSVHEFSRTLVFFLFFFCLFLGQTWINALGFWLSFPLYTFFAIFFVTSGLLISGVIMRYCSGFLKKSKQP